MDSFFLNDTTTTEICTLSLHDALPISLLAHFLPPFSGLSLWSTLDIASGISSRKCAEALAPLAASLLVAGRMATRSEEHTSELQSRHYLVCRLLLEKKIARLPLLLPVI